MERTISRIFNYAFRVWTSDVRLEQTSLTETAEVFTGKHGGENA